MKGTVLELFDAQVRSHESKPALSGSGEAVTYGELDIRANRVANALRSMGVRDGARVAISMERSPAVIVAILGVLKAGGAYVPLDPSNPDERLRLILADADPLVLLTESSLAERFAGFVNIVEIDRDGRVAAASPDPCSSAVRPDTLAYVIYTSGTTGRPKGVMVTHRNLERLMVSAEALFNFNESDVWTMFHSYGFDVSVWEMWGALGFGGRLIVPSANTVRSPDALYDLLAQEQVTVLCQTPSAFNSILDLEARTQRGDLQLRHVIFAGEALDPRRLAKWFEEHGDETPRMINMYGITETTIHSTFRRITKADCLAEAWSPIGVPLPHVDIRLLDESGEPVADGEVGEIHVLGDGVAEGYLNRPELTLERFSPSSDGLRMYRSGDLARRSPDGDLHYQGRADNQVQIRGFRVELGEIESALRRIPEVEDAVVTYSLDRPGGRLIGYVVLGSGHDGLSALEDTLRVNLSRHLPTYMLPSTYVAIEQIPLTVNGKVDRSALPPPEEVASPSEGTASASESTSARITAIWKNLLSVEHVNADTDFFEVGGHSLLAVEAMIRIQEEFGIDIALGTMFEHTTLAAVVSRVHDAIAGTEEFVL